MCSLKKNKKKTKTKMYRYKKRGFSRGKKSNFKQRFRRYFKKYTKPMSNMRRYVQPRMAPELKMVDYYFSTAYTAGTYTPDTEPFQQLPINQNTNLLQCVNLVQQGTGLPQRIGTKVTSKGLQIKLNVVRTNINQNNPQTCRFMVIYDRQPNGTYPATNQVLTILTQANVNGTGIFTSMLNPTFKERMTVLRDKIWTLPPVNATLSSTVMTLPGNAERTLIIEDYIKLKGLQTTFNGTANPMTIAQMQTGAVYILVFGSATANTTDGWQIGGNVRYTFYDV